MTEGVKDSEGFLLNVVEFSANFRQPTVICALYTLEFCVTMYVRQKFANMPNFQSLAQGPDVD